MDPFSEMLIIRVKDGDEQEKIDLVATETAITIVVNGEILVTLLCSPMDIKAMALGFLISEGL